MLKFNKKMLLLLACLNTFPLTTVSLLAEEPKSPIQVEFSENEITLMLFFKLAEELSTRLEQIEPGLSEEGIYCQRCGDILTFGILTGHMLHQDHIDKLDHWLNFISENRSADDVRSLARDLATRMQVPCSNCQIEF